VKGRRRADRKPGADYICFEDFFDLRRVADADFIAVAVSTMGLALRNTLINNPVSNYYHACFAKAEGREERGELLLQSKQHCHHH
jgi:hypothetical protein